MKLYFREATIADAHQYFDWANDINVRENSFSTKTIIWEDHIIWFKGKLQNINTQLYIFENDNIAVGQVRLDLIDGFWYIDYSVDRRYRGKGIGNFMINEILIKFPPNSIKAQVKKDNIASLKIFERAGFKIMCENILNGVIIIDFLK